MLVVVLFEIIPKLLRSCPVGAYSEINELQASATNLSARFKTHSGKVLEPIKNGP